MIVKDQLTLFPYTTPKTVYIYPEEVDLKLNLTRLNNLVVAMSIRNHTPGNDVFVFIVKGRKYLKLLTFESFGPLVMTVAGVKAREVLRILDVTLA